MEIKKIDKKFDSSPNMHQKVQKEKDKEIANKAYDLIEPLCNAEGLELVHVEYQCEAGG